MKSKNHISHPQWKDYWTLKTTIRGIPCELAGLWHRAYPGAREHGTGLRLEPDEPAGWSEILVFDRKGYHATWLEDRMTDEDWADAEQKLSTGEE